MTYSKGYKVRILAIALLASLLTAQPGPALSAEPSAGAEAPRPQADSSSFQSSDKATKDLLQQTLSAAELDKEIARIDAERKKLESRTRELHQQADKKEQSIAVQREQAGAVLRAYYTGDRDGLLMAFLSAKSLGRWLALMDYYEWIAGRDQEILARYEQEYEDLSRTLRAAEKAERELAEAREQLSAQRERIAALNREIDAGVAGSADPAQMNKLLKEFEMYWNNVGVREIRTYFKALSSAMKKLPDFLQSRDGALVRRGLVYDLNLTEDDLNEFLHEQNPMFQGLNFAFRDGKLIASGTDGNLELTLEGHYTLQDEPENALIFHVDRIVFNGLELPESTRRDLENDFDLGFYPSKIVSFLRATKLEMDEGVMHVKLSIHL
ncbi:hypothetical protein F4V43_03795 [Paenibacillus spiritus]|uniref:Uncharacterized protein n=1 Tax=Paenibacillus spiritus TaxID=2496557 RepID=A0A5J5GIT8_9BACL|nr:MULTISPECIES: hypothetical protein [Paenibacillus]KAA9007618.1 hypothetical protein F4V43_03795 [Paenibacillus spiritus]